MTVEQWVVCGLEITLLVVGWWRLRVRWSSEQSRASGLASMSLLTATVFFSFYERYALGAMAHKTADQFGIMLKMQGRYDAWGWLLSVAALISAIVWLRSSRHLASGLALGLGTWMCMAFTLVLVYS